MSLEAWTQLPILRALFGYGIVPKVLLEQHLKVRDTIGRGAFARLRALKSHVPGQLAPAGRLVTAETEAPSNLPAAHAVQSFTYPAAVESTMKAPAPAEPLTL